MPEPNPSILSDALLQRLFEVSPDPITVVDADTGVLVMLNEPFERMAGYRADELREPRAGAILWVDAAARERYLALLYKDGSVRDFPALLQPRDRAPISALVSATLFEHGGRRYLLAIARDVTSVERERLQLEAILGNAFVGIAFTRDRVFQHANPRFEEIFGWPAGQIVGHSGRAVWPTDEAYAEIGRAAAPLLQTGAAFEGEFEMARRDGSVFWASVRARAIDPKHPGSAGTIWIIDDVSERRRVALALADAKEQAEAANRAKSAFLANTSHEIRTPLNGLLGLVRLAQDPAIGAARLREYLQHIDDSAQTLAGLISDILDLSKIEAGRLTLEQVDFDLHALLHSVRDAYAELARAKGLAFDFEIGARVPTWVNGDPVRLRQIVANYMSNALKFTAAGGIGLRTSLQPDGRTRVEVRDSGPGVEPAVQARLFHPFSQADASTTRRFGGTGLGLSICRQLAVLMGGGVGMQSKPGEGSVFWADLPLFKAALPRRRIEQRRTAADALQDARLLLVEDNAVNTLVAEATLAQWGARVSVASDGAEAIAAVETAAAGGQPFDAVLMDLQMPVMSGIEATIAIRRQHGALELPIIALTADVLVSERDNAMRHGMNDFLSKPIDPERMVGVLAHWVRRSRQGRS